MEITALDILTESEYRSFQLGGNAPLRAEDITSAINLTFIQLNGICNNQIKLRWPVTDINNRLYLSDDKKALIKDAFKLQTKYNLDYDNDTSEGTVQANWGSNSSSITRPKRDKISQDVLNLLTNAGVYLQFTTQTIQTMPNACIKSAKYRNEFDRPITIEEAEQKFIPRFSPFEITSTRLFTYDENRNWTTIGVEDLISAMFSSIYPVGTIYTSKNADFDPNTAFGGTWIKIGEGNFLEATEIGSNVGQTHNAGAPNIGGTFAIKKIRDGGAVIDYWDNAFTDTGNIQLKSWGIQYMNISVEEGGYYRQTTFTASNGENYNGVYENNVYGKSNTIQPKSIMVYMWERTA